MNDTIKFRRYTPMVSVCGSVAEMEQDPEGLWVRYGDTTPMAPEVPGDKEMPKLSGKAIDYGDLAPRTAAWATKEMLNHVADALSYAFLKMPPPKPLTRRERIERWFVVRWERVVTAWKVLRGDDIQVEED